MVEQLMAPELHDDVLVQFVIYERPKDFPFGFVLRRWLIARDSVTPDHAWTYETLDDARRHIPPGLVCIARMPTDDPCIVEVWT